MTQPVKFSTLWNFDWIFESQEKCKPIYSPEKMDSVVYRGSIQKNGSKNLKEGFFDQIKSKFKTKNGYRYLNNPKIFEQINM